MAKIILQVNDKELDTLMNILRNLKEGLVEDITVDKKRYYKKLKSGEPLKPLQSSPQPVNVSTGKYIDPQTFKERLKRKK